MASTLNIMAALGLSPRLSAVAGEAMALAARLDGQVTLVHAGMDTPATRATIQAALHERPAGLAAPTVVIAPGRPDRVLTVEAQRQRADLVVAGALEREGALTMLLGSTARRLARSAPCAVLLLPHPRATGTAFTRILARVEYDDANRAMLGFAARLCRAYGQAHLRAYSEYDPVGLSATLAGGDQHSGEALARAWRAAELSSLVAFLESAPLAGLPVIPDCHESGTAGVAVTTGYASTDLLVLSAPASGSAWLDRFFRQAPEVLLGRLPCAVLLYRQPPRS